MQMKKDPAGGGTQVGNVLQLSLSKRIFYKKLHFRTNAVILQRQAKKMVFPRFLTGFMTSNLPKLERWKNKK